MGQQQLMSLHMTYLGVIAFLGRYVAIHALILMVYLITYLDNYTVIYAGRKYNLKAKVLLKE